MTEEDKRQYNKEYYQKNKYKIYKRWKKWCIVNPEKRKLQLIRYRKRNPDEIRRRGRIDARKRRENPQKRLRMNISTLIFKRLKRRLSGKYRKSSFDFLPYTIEDLMKHIESKFQKGMSWDNYGKWHIDHIIPDSSFHYKNINDAEFQKCWALENLQPLWAKDNLMKSNKYRATENKPKLPQFIKQESLFSP
tara:strand:+ start:415 stop:990 length:576 start_codon:yes stop_codon:yes gene_type:complete